MRNFSWLTVLGLVACTEYGLGSKPDPDGTTSSSTTTDDDEIEGDFCSDEPVEGFDAELNEECYTSIQTGTFTPVVEWDRPTFPGPVGDNVMSTPIVVQVTDDDGDGDIDTDDTPDIVFVSYGSEGILRAIDGATGSQHWAVTGYGLQPQGGVAGGDIDGDGVVELISLTWGGAVAFEHDGAVKWTSNNLSGHIYGISDVASISDMDHDGNPEIIAGRAILNGEDGSLQGAGSYGMGGAGTNVGSCSFAVDLDNDGTEEVITGNAAYNPDGSTKWHAANGADGYPAVADIDGDGQGEVIVSGQAEIRILDTDGSPLLRAPIPGAAYSTYYGGPPTIADFDGDGQPEIGVAAGSRYSVLETDGSVLWQATTDDGSSGNTGSAVFDFEGDGAAEVVYADQTRLWVFSGVDGSVKLSSTEHSNGTWLEYAVVADVDGDGHVEIVVPNEYQYGYQTGITVFGDADDSWQPGRKIWNQHAYHITNVNDDGTIPVEADLNWESFNSFRSGDLSSADGLLAPDLVAAGDLCEVECGDDRILVHVLPGNEGMSDVLESQRVTVEIFSEEDDDLDPIDSKRVRGDVRAGEFRESVVFEIEDEDIQDWDAIVVRVSSDALECELDNNEIRLQGPFCE